MIFRNNQISYVKIHFYKMLFNFEIKKFIERRKKKERKKKERKEKIFVINSYKFFSKIF